MAKQTFSVKDKSVHAFFQEHSIDPEGHNEMRGNATPYTFMRDEIILKSSSDFEVGTEVVFELEDRGCDARAKLVNTYTYIIEQYDDVSVRLMLTKFETEYKPQTT